MDEDGVKLVELPRNYQVLIERMIQDRRHEYRALQSWLGPRRFEGGAAAWGAAEAGWQALAAGMCARCARVFAVGRGLSGWLRAYASTEACPGSGSPQWVHPCTVRRTVGGVEGGTGP